MKKIELIQEENRKLILEAITPEGDFQTDGSYDSYIDEEGDIIIGEYKPEPLTLDRVLLSLSNKIERSKYVEFISLDNISNGVAFFEFEDDIESTNFNWDLTKPTLEEQTEETQRAINELLTN